MSKNRFDLEQEYMACWGIVEDLELLLEQLGDDEFFEGMDPKHQDYLMNYLLGIKTIASARFERGFKTFEDCVREKML